MGRGEKGGMKELASLSLFLFLFFTSSLSLYVPLSPPSRLSNEIPTELKSSG